MNLAQFLRALPPDPRSDGRRTEAQHRTGRQEVGAEASAGSTTAEPPLNKKTAAYCGLPSFSLRVGKAAVKSPLVPFTIPHTAHIRYVSVLQVP